MFVTHFTLPQRQNPKPLLHRQWEGSGRDITLTYFAKIANVNFALNNVVVAQYLSSCHGTASDTKYWTIRALFIVMTTSWLEKSKPA